IRSAPDERAAETPCLARASRGFLWRIYRFDKHCCLVHQRSEENIDLSRTGKGIKSVITSPCALNERHGKAAWRWLRAI
ncbi:hypothetical protein, partial [Pantoea ananatis]